MTGEVKEYLEVKDTINVGGRLSFGNGHVFAKVTTGPAMLNEAASSVNPTLIPDRSDFDTGIGHSSANVLSLIAGGIKATSYGASGSNILQIVESKVGQTAASGSSQGDGPITSSFNVYSIVGTAGHAATLPASFSLGTIVYIKNDAAANSMDVFPASGDDAGAGTNNAVAIANGDFAVFIGTVANSTWTKIMGGTA